MLKNVLSLKNIIWFCAIGLAVFSGYYSVYGISKLFTGGSFSIIGMAAMLELSKLVVVAFLHRYHSSLKNTFKIYLTLSAVVLMAITSIGVYGFLTNAYQETAKTVNQAQTEIQLLDKKLVIFQNQKSQVDAVIKQKTERVSQYDQIRVNQENTYSKLSTDRRGTRGLQQNIRGIEQTANKLNDEITQLNAKSMDISDSITVTEQKKVELTTSTFSSEMGPLLYLSKITGQPMDTVVNWFILFLVVVFDPLAVSLVIAANHISTRTRVETGSKYSDLMQNIPEGATTHSSTTNLTQAQPVEPPDEWLPENIVENVQQDDMISDTQNNLDTVENVEQLTNSNLEKIKEVTILDQEDQIDLDQFDLNDLDQEDQIDQIDLKDQLIEDQNSSSFEDQQEFYNEIKHRVNRASGGI